MSSSSNLCSISCRCPFVNSDSATIFQGASGSSVLSVVLYVLNNLDPACVSIQRYRMHVLIVPPVMPLALPVKGLPANSLEDVLYIGALFDTFIAEGGSNGSSGGTG